MDEDGFNDAGPPVAQLSVEPDIANSSGSEQKEHAKEKVCTQCTCYCQAPPQHVPKNYTPCCLPLGARISSREIQMFPEFRDNLLRKNREPAKTQTLRTWGKHRARAHKQSFWDGKWIRVWRGQGHKDTIGWLLITFWDEIKVGTLDHGDCVREGRPTWDVEKFRQKYCKGLDTDYELVRIRFEFRACRACL